MNYSTESIPGTTGVCEPLASLNQLPAAQFTNLLADVFEHSPWVAAGAENQRPFHSVDELHQAMLSVAQQASREQQLFLLRAHPALAGREAQQGQLTEHSDQEQARAGLKALSPAEMAHITELNAAYLARHGFPFIVCVGNHSKKSIFQHFERRLGNSAEDEMQEALAQVAEITRIRLEALFPSKTAETPLF